MSLFVHLHRKTETRHTHKTKVILNKHSTQHKKTISGLPVTVVAPDDSLEEVFLVPQVCVTFATVDKDRICITGC